MNGEALEAIREWFSSNTDIVWFLVYWGTLVLFAGLEVFTPAFQEEAQRQQRWPTNIGLGIVNMTLVPLVPVSAIWGAYWAQSQGLGLLNVVGIPWWAGVIATFLLRSLAGYIFHLLMHKVPLFWRLHRVHHSDMHLDVSTTVRSHPVEVVVLFLAMVPLAIAFGFNPWALIVYETIEGIVGLLSHTNLRLPERLDRALRWLLVTPNMHCLHHSSFQPETDSNYGVVLSIWDRLFDTYSVAPRNGYDAMKFGLNEIAFDQSSDIVWQIKSPIITIERATDDFAQDRQKA
jgi:sterol desaturase/sphingolipid hydroxylase (fatty acid hydroxylase superfamily)